MLQCDEPSPRRKRIALSLSLTAGAAALLATATAQETELRGGPDAPGEKSETAITRIITSTDGRSRELVIVTDPMHKVEAHLSRLDELEWPEPPQPPAYPSAPQPPPLDLSMLEELEGLEGLEALADIVAMASDGSSLSLNGGHVVITGKDGQRMAFSLNQEEVENFTAMIERRAEAFEARMEEWAANLEDSFEVNFEIDMERFEAEISRVEAEAEAITESPEFEALVERGTRSIEDLHEACDEKDLGDVGVAVVTSREGDKAICIDGEADREVVGSAIRKEVDLSEAEKQRLLSVIER